MKSLETGAQTDRSTVKRLHVAAGAGIVALALLFSPQSWSFDTIRCKTDVFVWAKWTKGHRKLLNPLKDSAEVDGTASPSILVMDKDKSEVLTFEPWNGGDWKPGKDFSRYDVKFEKDRDLNFKVRLRKKGDHAPEKKLDCQLELD